LNGIFLFLILSGIIVAAVQGNIDVVTQAAMNSSNLAVQRVIGFMGVVSLWMGIAKIAERSGLLNTISKLIQPFLRLLFPHIPKDNPALGYIVMNLTANMLGFGNAATPFGLKAMKELQLINPKKDTASPPMCTFLAINTSSVTLFPATVVAFRIAAGSTNPTEIVGTTLIATSISTLSAITLDILFRKLYGRR
jgi:spore maturation protein A